MINYPELSPVELHLLYVLLDSNLPTGGFVSSSGLESFAKHGFLSVPSTLNPYQTGMFDASSSSSNRKPTRNAQEIAAGVVGFAEAEVKHYASTTSVFVMEAWEIVTVALSTITAGTDQTSTSAAEPSSRESMSESVTEACLERTTCRGKTACKTPLGDYDPKGTLDSLKALDELQEATLLSHVARRASRAQGVAMLTLYTRGLSTPLGFDLYEEGEDGEKQRQSDMRSKQIVDSYKHLIRLGAAPGHLATCWGIITAALGINPVRALHLHLFLHARSLLSTAVRLNLIGPYASSQLLLHPFRDVIEKEATRVPHSLPPSLQKCACHTLPGIVAGTEEEEDFWDWADEAESGPATTWPLGEVLMGRHDLQHSRIFNS